jgi:hypothetical protein
MLKTVKNVNELRQFGLFVSNFFTHYSSPDHKFFSSFATGGSSRSFEHASISVPLFDNSLEHSAEIYQT